MIFTDRTIRVKKGASSIDNPIVLYRGDKEVEIRFTLSESFPFRFGVGAEPNIIEKTEAAYGQLVIKTPNDLPSIFSEIVPTNEGKIIFTITAEMIDEITEVGNYTFQIRLLDESRNSRATLPEVVNGIEIREPIATEDVSTTNEVGVATVGYALTTAGTTEDAFDSQGNYNKTTWGTGDRITAAKLNKIEVGIDGVNKKVASGGTGNINDTTASTTTTYSSNKIESIKENLSSQIKEIVNVADLAQEGNNVYIKDSNGNKVGNGITIQSSSTGSGGNITSSSDYSYEYMGTPFPALNNYQSWPIAGVQYDKSIDRIVCLVTDADKHVDSTQFKLSLYTLNPQTAEIKLIQTLRDNTVDPVVNLSNAFASQRGFLIDNDTGIYYKFHFGDDNIPKACKSEDKGVTWTDITINQTNTAWTPGGNGMIYKTSTGRIVCSLFGGGMAYTDDYFVNLTYCNNTKINENGAAQCHEADIIEYKDGTLQRIMRYSWASTNNGVWNGTKRIEPAWISTSSDNGATWTTPVASTSILDMSATNCSHAIDGDTLYLFVGSRNPYRDGNYGGMWLYTCSLDDAKNDNFGEGKFIGYANSLSNDDSGNLACCMDLRDNIHFFYCDAVEGETEAHKNRWHYIRGTKIVINNSSILLNPLNKEIQAYNAHKVDILLDSIYAHITNVKNELLIKIGELPDSGTVEDPTYWVTDGLVQMFVFDEGHYDSETGYFTPTYGDYSCQFMAVDGMYSTSKPSTLGNSYIKSKGCQPLFQDLFINSPNGFTIEVDCKGLTSSSCKTSVALSTFELNHNNSLNLSYSYEHYLREFNSTESKSTNPMYAKNFMDFNRAINTITWSIDRVNKKSYFACNGVILKELKEGEETEGYSYDISAWGTTSSLKSINMFDSSKTSIRFYNKSLSESELLANANYAEKIN